MTRVIKPEGDMVDVGAAIKSLKLWFTWYCIISPFGTAALMLFCGGCSRHNGKPTRGLVLGR